MSGSTARVIAARPLTDEDWAPFGWLPVADSDPRDRDFTYEFTLDDPHVNVIAHSPEEVSRVDGRHRSGQRHRRARATSRAPVAVELLHRAADAIGHLLHAQIEA